MNAEVSPSRVWIVVHGPPSQSVCSCATGMTVSSTTSGSSPLPLTTSVPAELVTVIRHVPNAVRV